MIPGQWDPEGDQTLSDQDQTADSDQTLADGDQTGSGRDQDASDRDQLAADKDQAASDRELGRETYDRTREARELATQARLVTSNERHATATARDATADQRDLSALVRDRAAEARDLEAERCDAEIAAVTSSYGTRRATDGASVILWAARDRERAAYDRRRSATHRVGAGVDREQAARDRLLAAGDRALAAEDRAQATAERQADEIDTVTGARRRAPGLAGLQRTIDRTRRGRGGLIAAYVDVDELKSINDTKGHHAGDVMLRHVVEVLQSNLRSYESVTRLGGDEFVCTMSDTTMDDARQHFDEINAELTATPDEGSINRGAGRTRAGRLADGPHRPRRPGTTRFSHHAKSHPRAWDLISPGWGLYVECVVRSNLRRTVFFGLSCRVGGDSSVREVDLDAGASEVDRRDEGVC